jgi:type II secretory pathway component PulL
MAKSYHMVAGIKMLAGIAVFLLAALLAGRTSAAQTIRQKWKLWLNVCLLLGLATVLLGSVLRSYPHNLKVDSNAAPQLIAPANSPAG